MCGPLARQLRELAARQGIAPELSLGRALSLLQDSLVVQLPLFSPLPALEKQAVLSLHVTQDGGGERCP